MQAVWAALRATVIAGGGAELLLRHGLLGLEATRQLLAWRYLPAGAAGLEIGALHCPLPLPPGTRARYVDRHAPAALRRLRSEAGASLVVPDFLADGFTLACVAEASQDFVIANHVLEHATDAWGTLDNWIRVLRPGGMLFVAVPIGAHCFDCDRAVTPVAHFVDDHHLTRSGNVKAMRARNRAHVEEHLARAAPRLARELGQTWSPPQGETREREIERLLGGDSSQIHHHVFTPASFAALLGLLGERIRVECVARSSVEVIGIVKKLS